MGGLAPAARGVPKIDVTFDVDTDRITIKETRGGMSKQDVDRLVDEAESFRPKDAFIEKVAARYYLDGVAVMIKNLISTEEARDLSAEDKEAMDGAVRDAFDWLEKNTHAEKEAFEAKQAELLDFVNPLLIKVGMEAFEASDLV